MSSTVILGAGIIGCSAAYYLSESTRTQAHNIHLVEASPELFQCASGLAGGFLAADWFAPSVAPLGALSFELHSQLAEKHNGREKWGYSRSTGISLSVDDEQAVGGSGEDWLRGGTSRAQAAGGVDFKESDRPEWLIKSEGTSIEVISREGSVAQIDPMRLCNFLLDQCRERGVRLHHPARAISVSKDSQGELASIRICTQDGTETDVPCTRLVLAAGAWTPKVFSQLFPSASTKIPVFSLAGHSLLLRSPRWSAEREEKGCHAVFATDTLGFSPELFSRLGGEIYMAGLNSTMIPLPDAAEYVKVRLEAMQQLKEAANRMLGSPEKEELQVLREGLCFRPVTSSGRPIVGRVPDAKLGGLSTRAGAEGGVFLATGHGAWGISQSLGTGKVLTELLEGQEPSANITALALP